MTRLYVILKADPQIGTGHLMRCLNLIQKLHNCEITFALPRISPQVKTLLGSFSSLELGAFEKFPEILQSYHDPDAVVLVDCYSLDASFEKKCRPFCKKLMVVDDLGNRPHDCDLLVDGNIGSIPAKYHSLVPHHCKLLTGNAYSLINPVFSSYRKTSLPEKFKTGLICFGGSDPVHGVLNTVKTILQSPLLSNLSYTIISGAINPDYEEISRLVAASRHHWTLLRHTDQMPQLLQSHDFSIGAAGGMSLERFCIGIPTIATEIADNQKGFKNLCDTFNLGVVLQPDDLCQKDKLEEAFLLLEQNGSTYMKNGQALVDGQGILRVAASMEELINTPSFL